MNNARRKTLGDLADELRNLSGQYDDIKTQIETVRDEEQEAFDNMPESLQGGEKGQLAEAAIEAMDEAIGSIEAIDSSLDDAIGSLETAQE